MKKYPLIMAVAIAATIFAFNSCNKQPQIKALSPNLPAQSYDYESVMNNQVLQEAGNNAPTNNQVTNAGATLGRVLFYDPSLSINNTVSCGSCHKQQYAFSDNVPLSTGYEGQLGTRNALPLINPSTKASFFWDGRATTLEQQDVMPVANHAEMGMEKLNVLTIKLSAISYYPQLFQNAFGTTQITEQEISFALAQFVRTIVSVNSRFDVTPFSEFTPQEKHGFSLFMDTFQCSNCHRGVNLGGASIVAPYFNEGAVQSTVQSISNIGLDMQYADGGVGTLLNNAKLNGDFVIPSLRNVALTAPYMHDGRFATLDQAVDHYSTGILPNANLDPFLLQPNFFRNSSLPAVPVEMNMTVQQKQDLITFLQTLTDYTVVNDPKYSNPFK